jgi:hypothetical protein
MSATHPKADSLGEGSGSLLCAQPPIQFPVNGSYADKPAIQDIEMDGGF